MTTWVALLRGINVGGSGRLPMASLAALLRDLGLEDVRTYLQSGNAVFRDTGHDAVRDAVALAAAIRREIEHRHGIETDVLLMDAARLEAVVRNNPFPEAEGDPRSLHAHFLSRPPEVPDPSGLADLKRGRERFVLGDGVLYLHLPDGIARSRLAAGAEKRLGVPMTGRNWRSVTRILALAKTVEASSHG